MTPYWIVLMLGGFTKFGTTPKGGVVAGVCFRIVISSGDRLEGEATNLAISCCQSTGCAASVILIDCLYVIESTLYSSGSL